MNSVATTDRPFLRVAAARFGFLADSYDLFAIDNVLLILRYNYTGLFGSGGATAESLVVSAMLAGVVIGQLSFGFLADSFGRKWAFIVTAGLTVLGALASAACWDDQHIGLALQLAFCRFLLGVGVGGEYPLSASVTAESGAAASDRRWLLASVVAMQGFGMLLASVVTLATLQWPQLSLEASWRLTLAFGAVPSLVAFVLRWHLHESQEFQEALNKGNSQGGKGWHNPLTLLSSLWRPLIGTALPWLVMNAVLYSLGSFKSIIFDGLFPMTSQGTPRDQVANAALFAALCSVFAIAGFAASLLLLFRSGSSSSGLDINSLQLGGFLALALVLSISAVLSSYRASIPPTVLVLCLGFMFFFQNCGPNTTTYVIAAEAYPTLLRASCHGISAASGKIGGVIGTASFGLLHDAAGMQAVYPVCACLSLIGALVTFSFAPRSNASALLEAYDKNYGSFDTSASEFAT